MEILIRHDELCARALRCFNQNIPAGIVVETGRQQLIAPAEFQGTGTAFTPVVAFVTKTRSRELAPINFASARRAAQSFFITPPEKLHRLGFQFAPQLSLVSEDGFRTRAKRTVIQEHRPGLEPQKRRKRLVWRRQFA